MKKYYSIENEITGLVNACSSGQLEVVEYLMNRIDVMTKQDLDKINKGLVFACARGYVEVVTYMLNSYISPYLSFADEGIMLASNSGYTKMVEFLDKSFKFNDNETINKTFFNASHMERHETLEYMLGSEQFIKNLSTESLAVILRNACQYGAVNIIQKLENKLNFENYKISLNEGTILACYDGEFKSIKYILNSSNLFIQLTTESLEVVFEEAYTSVFKRSHHQSELIDYFLYELEFKPNEQLMNKLKKYNLEFKTLLAKIEIRDEYLAIKNNHLNLGNICPEKKNSTIVIKI